jgi:hypothetical protein
MSGDAKSIKQPKMICNVLRGASLPCIIAYPVNATTIVATAIPVSPVITTSIQRAASTITLDEVVPSTFTARLRIALSEYDLGAEHTWDAGAG